MPRQPPPGLLIEQPELQPRLHRAGWLLGSLFFWGLWVLLLLPVIRLFWIFVQWSFGFPVMLPPEMPYAVGHALLVSSIGYGGLVFWARLNIVRFSGKDRRRAANSVTTAAMARHFCIPEAQLDEWSNAKSLIVHFSPDGKPMRAEVEKPTAVAQEAATLT